MKNKAFVIGLFFVITVESFSQQTGSFVKAFTFSSQVYPNQARTMAYYVPSNYSVSKKYKLFISLGGQGWTPANDLISPYGPSSPGTVDLLKNPSYAATYGDFIAVSPSISPQAKAAGAPDGTWPYPDDADDGLPEAIIKEVKAMYNIDTNYVYLTGFSLGARGALDLGLQSYKKLRGLILFTPAVQGLNEAKNLDFYQTAANPFCYYNYANAAHIPICITVGASDPNGAGCSFCSPADPVKSYATVIVPEVKNQLLAAGAGNHLQYTSVPGLGHSRPSASYMNSCFNFIEGLLTTGVSQEEPQPELSTVFPNPSNGIFHFTSIGFSDYQNADVKISDMFGRQVSFARSGTDNLTVDLLNNAAGVYFMELKNGGLISTVKLVVER